MKIIYNILKCEKKYIYSKLFDYIIIHNSYQFPNPDCLFSTQQNLLD